MQPETETTMEEATENRDAAAETAAVPEPDATVETDAETRREVGGKDDVTVDYFAVLLAVGSNPDSFAEAQAEVAKAAKDIFVRQASVRGLALARLRLMHDAVGASAFASLLPSLKSGDLSRLVQSVDPHKPGVAAMGAREAMGRVAELAGGTAPTASADVSSLDLDGLRAARETLGPDFDAWIASLKGGESRKAAARLDPDLPGVAAMEPDVAKAHLKALADGLEPTVAVALGEIDVAGLRTAREYLGEGFATWLSDLKQGEAKKTLARLDPHRPGLSSMEPADVKERLKALAEGEEPSVAIPLDDIDLAGLGAAREAVGQEAFDAWLADLKPAEAKKAVIRLDPERPGVRKLRPEEYREALASLAERMAPHAGGRRVPGVGEITFGRARHDEERYPEGTEEDGA